MKDDIINKFYITTAIPYVNGSPHIGHALEYFQADVLRNYHKLIGDDTLLLSGADENALKNVQAAEKADMSIQDFLDKNSKVFENSYDRLGVKLDVFQRGSDKEKHFPGVQELWRRCFENGDIYKKAYTGLYCVGCESYKTENELENGKCPDHQKEPEKVEEENYFFKLSNYQDKLLEIIKSGEFKIEPTNKKNEVISFIKHGLEDFSISRSKERAKGVGVPVPNDPEQVMYVWFDALSIYITGIGFHTNMEKFEKWWPADVHVIGKDINRFHTVYWPAMLMSAGLELPKTILIHSFITSNGQKMSKSLGNVVDPFEMVDKYGLEPFRYYILSQIPIETDGDFTEDRFKEIYKADLQDGLGNLVSRVAKLCEVNEVENTTLPNDINDEIKIDIESYNFNEALQKIRGIITTADKTINDYKPWELKKEEAANVLLMLVGYLNQIAYNLQPFLPKTSEKILNHFTKGKITAIEPIFPPLK